MTFLVVDGARVPMPIAGDATAGIDLPDHSIRSSVHSLRCLSCLLRPGIVFRTVLNRECVTMRRVTRDLPVLHPSRHSTLITNYYTVLKRAL